MKFTFREYLANEINNEKIFNEKQIAKRVIQYLREKISIIDYIIKFQKKINFIQ